MKCRSAIFAFSVGLAVLLAAAVARSADPAPLRVGAAAVNFKADDSMQLGGHMHAVFPKGQEGELRAVATVIEQTGSGKFAIVACDVLFVTREMIDRAAAAIEKSCGIEPAHLLVNATHTHSAPSTVRIHGAQAEPQFVRTVEAGIVQAVEQANARLADDCRFLFRLGQEPNVGSNSRMLLPDGMISWGNSADPLARPTGPFDPELPVWVFRGPNDKLLSVIYNHSTHTVGSLRPNVRSPSFYGLAAQALEEQWGAPVCFLEGASGSTHNGGRPLTDLIADLKRDVIDGVEQAKPRAVRRIVACKQPFLYKIRTFDEATEDKKVTDYMTAHSPGDFDFVTGVFREARAAIKPHQGEERETFVQVMLIGDVALVGLPAEFFTGLGMEIKRRSPFADTYVAELANDWIGYTPDREAFNLGGYQTWTGSHSFAEVGTGERMVDQAVAMLDELADKQAAAAQIPAAQADKPTPRTRRILYNLDGDSCMWTKKAGKQPVVVAADDMKTLIDEIAYPGSQVDTLLLCTSAQTTYYPSKIGTMRGTLTPPAERAKWPAWEQQLFDNMQAMFAKGVDPYALLLAEARRRGLEALLTYRMNDIHDMEPLRCKFWLEHPEYRLANHVPGSKYFQPGVRAGFDFAHQAVRDYTFRLIEEAVQRYDCDGTELDFVRAPIFFQNGTETERIAMINDLVQRVRQMLDTEGKKRGRRLVLAARVLADDQECRESGLDPAAWAAEGWIDFLTVSPYSGTRYDLPVKSWKKRITGVPIYACADSAGPAANYRLAASNFWKDGADGIYLFNFFTPREVFVEPPFEVLTELGDPQKLQTAQ